MYTEYFHVENVFKKPYSVYLTIGHGLLDLDRDFVKSSFGTDGIKVTIATTIALRKLTPTKLYIAISGNIDRF